MVRRERRFESLDGALRFLVRGMEDGSCFPGELLDESFGTVATYAWLLDHWADVLDVLAAGRPPSSQEAVRELTAS